MRLWLWIVVFSFVIGGRSLLAFADAPSVDSTADLELQVAALTTLDELELTPDQLASLQSLAADTADDSYVSPANAPRNEIYREAMQALRDALAAGDEERIARTQAQIEKLRKNLNIAPPPAVNTSDAARRKAYSAVLILTTGQFANYIAIHASEIPDATETILDALDQCQSGSDDEFASLRDQAADQVAMLMNGENARMSKGIINRVKDLLDRARRMSSDDFQSSRPDLDRTARNITRIAHPDVELRNWMERQMAFLLSNPQLDAALTARSH